MVNFQAIVNMLFMYIMQLNGNTDRNYCDPDQYPDIRPDTYPDPNPDMISGSVSGSISGHDTRIEMKLSCPARYRPIDATAPVHPYTGTQAYANGDIVVKMLLLIATCHTHKSKPGKVGTTSRSCSRPELTKYTGAHDLTHKTKELHASGLHAATFFTRPLYSSSSS